MTVVQTGGKSVRLAAEFTDFVLQIGSWKTQFSLSAVRPQGWVQTTYLVSGAAAWQDRVRQGRTSTTAQLPDSDLKPLFIF